MIRRAPTRIELSMDDIEEYEQIKKERAGQVDEDSKTETKQQESKKATTAQRIGISGPKK